MPELRHRGHFLIAGAAFFVIATVFAAIHTGPAADAIDRFVLRRVAEWRSPLVTSMFISLTALGSTTLIVLHTLVGFALLKSTRDHTGALQLVVASGGSWILTQLAKSFVERPRPTEIPALAEATGFSYPSGHAFTAAAMYVTVAILVSRHLRLRHQRLVIAVWISLILTGIAFSRVYLGVHYPTDILSGLLAGVGWALVLEGIWGPSKWGPQPFGDGGRPLSNSS